MLPAIVAEPCHGQGALAAFDLSLQMRATVSEHYLLAAWAGSVSSLWAVVLPLHQRGTCGQSMQSLTWQKRGASLSWLPVLSPA